MRFFGLLAAAILLVGYASSVGRPNAAQDGSLEFSCAAFPADTTEADLRERFGAGSVARGPVIGSDDGPTEGTVLFPERPDYRLEIRWRDYKSQRAPEWIAARGVADTWKTPSGIAVGMDLRQLERANQRPFRLAGLQTEIHGRVLSWPGGRVAHV